MHLTVIGVVFRRPPSEIADAVIRLVAVEMAYLVGWGWSRRQELPGNEPMDCKSLSPSIHGQADGEIAVLMRNLGKFPFAIPTPIVLHRKNATICGDAIARSVLRAHDTYLPPRA